MPTPQPWRARALPRGIVGSKVKVYDALLSMLTSPPKRTDQGWTNTDRDEVYFRKGDVIERSGVSAPHVAVCLRWLHENAYITYTPGGPGRLSHARIATEAEEVEDGTTR